MKKSILITLLVIIITLISNNTYSQFRVDYFDDFRTEGALAYNFFVGEDSELFETTIKGFGSGFMLDLFTGRNSFNVMSIGWDNFNVSLGMGVAITKYRFERNLVFDKVDGIVQIYEDPDSNRDYVNTFFGYGKSKIVYGSFFTPVNLNITIGDILISGGGLLDFYISGKHKRKFIEDDNNEKIKVGNSSFRNYDISKTKLGLSALIKHIPTGLNISVTYMITPFFKEDYLPTVNEMRISFGMDIRTPSFDKIKKRGITTRQV